MYTHTEIWGGKVVKIIPANPTWKGKLFWERILITQTKSEDFPRMMRRKNCWNFPMKFTNPFHAWNNSSLLRRLDTKQKSEAEKVSKLNSPSTVKTKSHETCNILIITHSHVLYVFKHIIWLITVFQPFMCLVHIIHIIQVGVWCCCQVSARKLIIYSTNWWKLKPYKPQWELPIHHTQSPRSAGDYNFKHRKIFEF